MYKWLLCWRYLFTRYLALVSIISVMLGVGTLIVVNSVMSGFATKLMTKLKGMQSDIIVTQSSVFGFRQLDAKQEEVRQKLGNKIKAISPVIESFAMLRYRANGNPNNPPVQMPVRVMGIDPATHSLTSEFANFLIDEENRINPGKSFELHGKAGENFQQFKQLFYRSPVNNLPFPSTKPPEILPAGGQENSLPPPQLENSLLNEPIKPLCVVIGYNIARQRFKGKKSNMPEDYTYIHPGDPVELLFFSRDDVQTFDGGQSHPRVPNWDKHVVTDFLKSGMAEIDSMFVFVHIKDLQNLMVMPNAATMLQIKLADEKYEDEVLRELTDIFPVDMHFRVETWRDRSGPVLAAISMERAILNVLLFLIVAVAGFGILAIFFMIVVEKTRDIGIMKALGASSRGVMGIFLGYGLLLGIVGAGLGTIGGLAFTYYINEIEAFLAQRSGIEVFPKDMYYFDKIPTNISPWMLLGVNAGAIAIAVAASIFPAIRAALLRPVRALRFE